EGVTGPGEVGYFEAQVCKAGREGSAEQRSCPPRTQTVPVQVQFGQPPQQGRTGQRRNALVADVARGHRQPPETRNVNRGRQRLDELSPLVEPIQRKRREPRETTGTSQPARPETSRVCCLGGP